MRWYEEFPQWNEESKKCPMCKSVTCKNSPTAIEKERSAVLQISREKTVVESKRPCLGRTAIRGIDSEDLRKIVAVRNTVRKLERDIHREIMAAFAEPVRIA